MSSRAPRHLRKRSFQLAGHRTSVALEPAFWEVLEQMAEKGGVSLSALVAEVDAGREDPSLPLASALRVHALRGSAPQTPRQEPGRTHASDPGPASV